MWTKQNKLCNEAEERELWKNNYSKLAERDFYTIYIG